MNHQKLGAKLCVAALVTISEASVVREWLLDPPRSLPAPQPSPWLHDHIRPCVWEPHCGERSPHGGAAESRGSPRPAPAGPQAAKGSPGEGGQGSLLHGPPLGGRGWVPLSLPLEISPLRCQVSRVQRAARSKVGTQAGRVSLGSLPVFPPVWGLATPLRALSSRWASGSASLCCPGSAGIKRRWVPTLACTYTYTHTHRRLCTCVHLGQTHGV